MTDQPAITTHQRLGIGIDFGTSNSAAAIFDGQRIHRIQLETASPIMPSATYIDRQFKLKTGQAAIDEYIESNMGRTVELSAEVIGEGRTTTGQVGDCGLPEEAKTETIYGQSFVDGGQKGRLFRGIKRLLGNRSTPRLMIFNRPFRLVALITPLILRIRGGLIAKQRKLNLSQDDRYHACIGHPVNFEGSGPRHNQAALSLLSESYGHAGFADQSFCPEPIAAALSYLHQHPAAQAETLLAVDFGGGTLDLCVLRRIGNDFKVIATHGTGLGGDHIDQLMFRELIFPLLGKGTRWRRAGEDREIETLFPFEDYEELLLNWAVSYMLNQNRYTSPLMQRIGSSDESGDESGDATASKFRRLYDLIKNNYSYLVFQSLKELKAELSSKSHARLDIPELDIELQVSRERFEQIIDELLHRVQDVIEEVMDKAKLDKKDIQLVIRTGGSSLIPAVKHILNDLFPDKVIEHDPFTSVAAGLAIAEYKGLASKEIAESATSISQPDRSGVTTAARQEQSA